MRHLGDDAWRQVDVDRIDHIVRQRLADVRGHQPLGQLLPVGLAAAVVLDLDVQVLAAFGAELLSTVLVRTNERLLDLLGSPSEVLLPPQRA